MTMNIFLLPATNKNNKYIELTKQALGRESDIHVVGLPHDSLWRILPMLFRADVRATKNIIHIHWPTVLYGSRFAARSLFLLGLNIKIILLLKYVFGFKVVSTVHNFFAHDYPYPWIDAIGRSLVRRVSDHIILQQQETLNFYSKKYPHKKVSYIPHGNYIDVYGPVVPRDVSLRESFGFGVDDIVLLSFGAIAPYKMNEKIIDACIRARQKNSRLKVLVVGKGDPAYVQSLARHADGARDAVVIKNAFVADRDIPRFCSIADYSVFYYDASEMTSGGIVLSLSYGVPVITRNIPAAELVTKEDGFVFEAEAGLEAVLTGLDAGYSEERRRDIIDRIRPHNWHFVAEKLTFLYHGLFR